MTALTSAATTRQHSVLDPTVLTPPVAVLDLDVAVGVPAIAPQIIDGASARFAWLSVRYADEIIGTAIVALGEYGASAHAVAAAVDAACGELIAERRTDPERFRRTCATAATNGLQMTVVICTRDRPADFTRALASLDGQTYERFDVLVIDNAPATDATREVVAAYQGPRRVTYLREDRPGLSWARNCALDHVAAPVVAWLDDDETADANWLAALAAAWLDRPYLAAVSGTVLPAELTTWPQIWFEQYGGHSKGRGFTPEVFDVAAGLAQSPLYPLPPFGVGANMAFRVEALRAIGGFDPALGAGTRTYGAEDTLAFTQLLLRGGVVAYQPAATTMHFHRADLAALQRQMRGYGVGLTAYYTAALAHDWRVAKALLRLVPRGLRDVSVQDGAVKGGLSPAFPRTLLTAKSRGLAIGPAAYVAARVTARRLRRSSP